MGAHAREVAVRGDMTGERVWWLPGSARLQWRSLDDVEVLGAVIRDLLALDGADPDVRAVARSALAGLSGELAPSGPRRWQRLRDLWMRHGPETIAPAERVGIPHRLWDRLLRWLGMEAAHRDGRALVGGHGPGALGVDLGHAIEWWGLPEASGAAHDNRLHAWGAVEIVRPGEPALVELSPRLAWRSDGDRWHPHASLARAVRALRATRAPPRVDAGPGYLLACIVDVVDTLTRGSRYTDRDLAALWGTTLLPLLALTVEREPAAGPPDPAIGEPDYMQTLPFYLLHPRVQASIAVLDHLCTMLMAEDHASLGELLVALGRAAPDQPVSVRSSGDIAGRILALIGDIAERALHRRAASRWNSGFGFKLFRNLLREVLAEEPGCFCRIWDRAVHGSPQQAARGGEATLDGNLTLRLREALGTALWFPGRPPYADGPVAQRVTELVWLRWTDERFLAG